MSLFAFLERNAPWLAAGALMTFLSSFGQTFFISIFAGEIRQTFSLSPGQWGGIYTLGTSLSALAMIWAGGLTDVFRVRVLGPSILSGLALSCLAMAFNPWAGALVAIIFALRFFGQGMSMQIAVVAMTRWFDASRGRALSIAALGFSFGEAVLPLGFVALKGLLDWHYLWMAAAAVTMVAIPLLFWMLRTERTPQSHAQAAVSPGMKGRHWTRAEALTHPLFWFMVPALLGPAAFGTALFFHQVYLAEVKGWAHIDLVRLFPAFTGLAVGSMIFSGWALDKLGSSRLMPFAQLPAVMAFVAFAWAGSPGQMFVGLACYAVTMGTLATLPNAFWAEVYGTAHIGSIKATASAVMVFGSAIGPGLTGWLIDSGVTLERQFIGISGYFLVSTLFMLVGIGRARKDMSLPGNIAAP